MKRKIFIILFCFICVIIYADENYYFKENILINRGYTKFDPSEYSSFDIYEDCYNEIFHKDFRFAKTGIRRIHDVALDDDFEYDLLFILERDDLPNILVIVFIENDGKLWGFYKKNIFLDGITMNKITMNIETMEMEQECMLVFY